MNTQEPVYWKVYEDIRAPEDFLATCWETYVLEALVEARRRGRRYVWPSMVMTIQRADPLLWDEYLREVRVSGYTVPL